MTDFMNTPDPELIAGIYSYGKHDIIRNHTPIYKDSEWWSNVTGAPHKAKTINDALNATNAAKSKPFMVYSTDHEGTYDLRAGDGLWLGSGSHANMDAKANNLNTYLGLTAESPASVVKPYQYEQAETPVSVAESPASVVQPEIASVWPCHAKSGGYECDLDTGHTGDHVARRGDYSVVEKWPQAETPVPDASPWLGAPEGVEIKVNIADGGVGTPRSFFVRNIADMKDEFFHKPVPHNKHILKTVNDRQWYLIETRAEIVALCVAAIYQHHANRVNIGEAVEERTLASDYKDVLDEMCKIDDRLEAVEAAHANATDIRDGLKDVCKDLHRRLETALSHIRSQQSEITSMHTRINTQRNRASTIEAKLEVLGRRVKSREEVESNDTTTG